MRRIAPFSVTAGKSWFTLCGIDVFTWRT
ncbi:bacterioferritin, partial [Arthrobacter stackebrandtii]